MTPSATLYTILYAIPYTTLYATLYTILSTRGKPELKSTGNTGQKKTDLFGLVAYPI